MLIKYHKTGDVKKNEWVLFGKNFYMIIWFLFPINFNVKCYVSLLNCPLTEGVFFFLKGRTLKQPTRFYEYL